MKIRRGFIMKLCLKRSLSKGNLEGFNYEETKRNVNNYFMNLETLQWELEKLNAQRGLTANYDFSAEYRKQPFVQIGAEILRLSAKDLKEKELKEYISNFYWARSILTDEEQLYIMEYFIEQKYEDEIVDVLGFNNSDSRAFKKLKRSAIYKFADFLSILVQKKRGQ